MEPNVCFEPCIDSNTLKHLVTYVPDPPTLAFEANILQPAWQQSNSVSSRILKHLVTDVPDPPEDSGIFCTLLNCLRFQEIWLSLVEYFHVKPSSFPEFYKTFYGSAAFQDRHVTGPAAGELSLHGELFNNNKKVENKSKVLTQRSLKTSSTWDKNSIVLLCVYLFLPVTVCGFHTLQLSYGCELHNDGVGAGYYQYGFDGTDFLIFQRNILLWIAGTQKAEISAQRWNSDRAIGEGVQLYLTEHCTSALKKYIGYGKEELEKKVRPEVKMWGRRQADGATRLQCLVYGFHPRAVDVKWMKNGVDLVPSDEMTPILPHPDGTYQMRVGVEVPTTKEDTYSCHVEHSSLGEETLSVKWDPESDHLIIVIITVIVIGVILSVVLLMVLKLKREKTEIY